MRRISALGLHSCIGDCQERLKAKFQTPDGLASTDLVWFSSAS